MRMIKIVFCLKKIITSFHGLFKHHYSYEQHCLEIVGIKIVKIICDSDLIYDHCKCIN